MALTKIEIASSSSSDSSGSSGSTSNPDTQIAALATSNNAIVYTVPTGRKFVGWTSSQYNYDTNTNYAPRLVVGTVEVLHSSSFSAQPYASTRTAMAAPEITLLAGTSVKVGTTGNATYVFGVESDA